MGKNNFLLLMVGAFCCVSVSQAQNWIQLERIDVRPNGTGTNQTLAIHSAVISQGGRWLVFSSNASDLVNGDNNGVEDIFIRDRHLNITTRPITKTNGNQTTGLSTEPAISPDGRYVLFVSDDTDLINGDTNFKPDSFLLDRDTDNNGQFDEPNNTSITRISEHLNGSQLFPGVEKMRGAVNESGEQLAFVTLANIDPTDNNSKIDVYVNDMEQPTLKPMSVDSSGAIGNNRSPGFFKSDLKISHDGRFVAFSSDASNLVSGDTNSATDVFIHDRDSNNNGVFDQLSGVRTMRASVGDGGSEINGSTFQFDLSGDGEILVFSQLESITPGDTNPAGGDIFVYQTTNGDVMRVPFDSNEWIKADSCCGNQFPKISADGNLILFQSTQLYNFPNNITGQRHDVFAYNRAQDELQRVTDFPVPVSQSDGWMAELFALSPDGNYAVINIREASGGQTGTAGTYVYVNDLIFNDYFE